MPAPPPILLAEDEDSDVFFLRHALEQSGLPNPLIVATDGKDAVEYLNGDAPYIDRSKHPLPGLLLLDLKMPRMDGFAVLAWLQAHPSLKHLPVVVLTSSSDTSDREKALQLGAADCLIKPGNPQDLVKLLQDIHARWLCS